MSPPTVKPGVEVLLEEEFPRLRAARGGLLVHPASVDSKLRHTFDLLVDAGLDVTAVFGPEHGITGSAQYMEAVGDKADDGSGIPLFSLYGPDAASLRPTAEALDRIDLLVCDLQDIGARYYTYAATMARCMEACARTGKGVIVLDRPNPIGGLAVEGGVVGDGYESFVGAFPVATRHAMTIGELAKYFNDVHSIGCDLEVVPMQGWSRGMMFDETGLPWVMPSPNMPTPETALAYPGTCLLEGTNLSEGRGTTRPFEIVGAPWLHAESLARDLNAINLPGATFRPVAFRPTFDKWSDAECGGVQIHVLDRGAFLPVRTGLAILERARAADPDRFAWRSEPYEFETAIPAIDLLAGGDGLRRCIEADRPVREMEAQWEVARQGFEIARERCLIYRD